VDYILFETQPSSRPQQLPLKAAAECMVSLGFPTPHEIAKWVGDRFTIFYQIWARFFGRIIAGVLWRIIFVCISIMTKSLNL